MADEGFVVTEWCEDPISRIASGIFAGFYFVPALVQFRYVSIAVHESPRWPLVFRSEHALLSLECCFCAWPSPESFGKRSIVSGSEWVLVWHLD